MSTPETRVLSTRLAPAQRALVDAIAAARGVSPCAWVRAIVVAAVRQELAQLARADGPAADRDAEPAA